MTGLCLEDNESEVTHNLKHTWAGNHYLQLQGIKTLEKCNCLKVYYERMGGTQILDISNKAAEVLGLRM